MGVRVCEIRNVGSDLTIRQPGGGNLNPASHRPRLAGIARCNVLKVDGNRGLVLQEPLPGVLERSEENRRFSGPPDVSPGEGRDRPVRRLWEGEGGVSVAGGAGEGL